jgi:NADH oxidase (H2O2-forming)
MELADVLYKKGMKVTIVEALPGILPKTLDEDMSDVIHQNISDKISVFTNHLVTCVEKQDGRVNSIVMKNKVTGQEEKIGADLLIIATGNKPEVSVAEKAGCKIGKTGGIVVNEKCETSVKDVYAVGDCTEYRDFVTKQPVLVGLGSIAVRQGITAGITAAGGKYELPDGVLQTCTSEFFGFETASVGPITDSLDGFDVVSGRFNGSSLPDYYPGGKPITIKVFADGKTGKILGAQAVGDKAAQRINTFACAILNSMDVESFRKLETAYAPPIAPTLDAVTLVCDIVSMKMSRKKR